MFNPMMNMAMFMLLLSTTLVVLSSSWLMMWLLMEFNMMMFIPFLNFKIMNNEVEASIKYFLAQATGSAILIFSTIPINPNYYSYYMLLFALFMKIGSAPCYFWFVSVMKASNWMTCSLLMTWQKLAPLYMMSKISLSLNFMFMLVSLANILIGGMFGLNQSSMKSLLAYSSVSHLGWMMMLMHHTCMMSMWKYLTIYLMILMPLCCMMIKMSPKNNNQLFNISIMNNTSSILMSIMLLSLAGVPPLSGFLLKLMALFPITLLNMNHSIIMVMFSIFSLYMYLSLMLPGTLITNISTKLYSYKMMMKVSLMNMFLIPAILILYAMTIFNKP
nr:TPA: NADH dehydrogenase subunit 2 [Bdellodrilus illuminatus]